MIKATVDGNTLQFNEGISILEACRSLDVNIPTLCNDQRLKPIGSCRMCLVELEGRPHLVTSCNTLLADGMVISTHTFALEKERAMLLRMMAKDHPADVFRCFPDKDLHRLATKSTSL